MANKAGIKDAKDRETVPGCANAAGTHKCKCALIGKSLHPVLKEWISYQSTILTKRHGLPGTSFLFRFTDILPAACVHCWEVGLTYNCKLLLFCNNCSAHLPAEIFIKIMFMDWGVGKPVVEQLPSTHEAWVWSPALSPKHQNNVYVLYFPPNVTSLIQHVTRSLWINEG